MKLHFQIAFDIILAWQCQKTWFNVHFQIAVEFCEDAAYNGLLYVESRFCPNFLVGDSGSFFLVE